VVVIGPRASASPFGAAVAVDTGVAGVHEAGTAFRMDDVPVRLRAVLEGVAAPPTGAVIRALNEGLARR
jgi:formylmethanofuran dehydrogenase subunit B